MKFLVIGASGFLGKHTQVYLRASGYETIGTQSSSTASGLVSFNLQSDRIAQAVPGSFFKDGQPVFAIVSACASQIDRCFSQQELCREINVTGTIRLLRDLVALGAKPLFISSGCVFDGVRGYYNEEDPINPISVYGKQKAEVEQFISQEMPSVPILRVDKLLGDQPSEKHPFTEWYSWIQSGKPIVCIQDQLFSPTSVDDVAKAILLACQNNLSGIFHVSNSEFFYRDELARQFVATLKAEVDVICKTQKELGFLDLRPQKSYLDSSKFTQATGMRFTSMRNLIDSFHEKVLASP